jgi:hypothetical protein
MGDWGSAPTVLIFADSPEASAFALERVAATGGRIAATLPVDQAADRLDRQIAVDLVIVDVVTDHGGELDRLFDRIETGAAAGRFAAIVMIAPDLIDIASARIGHDAVSLLAERDEAAFDMAIAERLRASEPQLRDKSEAERGLPIQHILDEMARFVRDPDMVPSPDEDPLEPPRDIDDATPVEAALIRDMIRARRLRDELFGPGLFADPAWDILLDLTAARIEGRSVAVSSLCIAAAVPATTALRWIKQLTETGLLRRVADPDDGRRIFIELSDAAARRMMIYFANTFPAGRS